VIAHATYALCRSQPEPEMHGVGPEFTSLSGNIYQIIKVDPNFGPTLWILPAGGARRRGVLGLPLAGGALLGGDGARFPPPSGRDPGAMSPLAKASFSQRLSFM
jgi:hypothetical protein